MPQPEERTRVKKVLHWIAGLPVRILIGLVIAYQWTLSPLIGRHCRFEPSCSNYMILALKKYGFWRGLAKGILRILRCNPWNAGGYDPP